MSEDLVIENIRMKELVIVVNQNQGFFDEFLLFLTAVRLTVLDFDASYATTMT